MNTLKKTIVLLSGGLDSATCLAMAMNNKYSVYALSFNYGQRHKFEITSAKRIASKYAIEKHKIIDIDLTTFGGSALTDDIEVPQHEMVDDITNDIPVTYVPARNTIFLSYALAWAEVLECYNIFIGVNALDYSGYPDCRPEYIDAFQTMANLATKSGVEGSESIQIHTPLLHLTKAQIIQNGIKLGVDYRLTFSCYNPDESGTSCRKCDACILRLKGFKEAGLSDPISYQS
ncbi:MAG: 7-cyano-7-deazaguanine synthase QueC [Candidatus Marinimicrobia bacterium]|jgi:7-cyano-7-deazaguanine synthase|nr:7-cyano-7-deazaguanine synthase QueC [Candidatus Neomarinimicrobiota bacterium]MBT3617649.1 7-cyano-7-deazaguanine synthase QueC [Candidatus Neomarinimicrobiota bacterium]MBT3829077.1 7-cyano-7-deazaguanine synthase QueC [Candidatus Neomarinimicrobiota bacterium]MBT3997741.1 7-cyano-7-deazaguanine synthase QueC [Candidatus Neomarinimicrobiota bacterium]MBT4281372.1 7-cyano-7-deazaguanine synthase QueC [Candidatus Neomarinimicrobiota bacterium]